MSKWSEKLFNGKNLEILIYLIILLSIPYNKQTLVAKEISKTILIIIFLFISVTRLFILKRNKMQRSFLTISFDEKIIIAIAVTGIVAGLLYHDDVYKGVVSPSLFFLTYFGISSYSKVVDITEKLIVRILKFTAIIVTIHTVIEYYFSFPALSGYLLGQISYTDYVWKSWNLLYPNYNYFARNVMIGFICSISLYFYYLVQGVDSHKRNIVFIFTCFMGLTLLLSYSRTSILAVITYTFFIILSSTIIHHGQIKELLTKRKAILIIVIIGIGFYFLSYYNFIDEIIIKTKNQGSTYRFELWHAFIEQEMKLFPDLKFFIGHGYMNWNSIFYRIWSQIDGKHVHNNFFFIWYNYGLVSMSLFIFLLLKVLASNVKEINKTWFIYFIPLSYMSVSFFESTITRYNFRFEVVFFLLFLSLPYNYYLKNRLSNNTTSL